MGFEHALFSLVRVNLNCEGPLHSISLASRPHFRRWNPIKPNFISLFRLNTSYLVIPNYFPLTRTVFLDPCTFLSSHRGPRLNSTGVCKGGMLPGCLPTWFGACFSNLACLLCVWVITIACISVLCWINNAQWGLYNTWHTWIRKGFK